MKHIITLSVCALLATVSASADNLLPDWYYQTTNYKQLADSLICRYKQSDDADLKDEVLNVFITRLSTQKKTFKFLNVLAQTNQISDKTAKMLFAELTKNPKNAKILDLYKGCSHIVPEAEFRELFKSEAVQNDDKVRAIYEVILLKRNVQDFIDIALADIDKQLKSQNSVIAVNDLILELTKVYNKKVYGRLLAWAAQNPAKFVESGQICTDIASDDDEAEAPCSPMYASVARFIVDKIHNQKVVKGFPDNFEYKNGCSSPVNMPSDYCDYICNDDPILTWCKQQQKMVTFETQTRKTHGVAVNKIVRKDNYEYVDLGLGVLWATYNVGAESDSQLGNYYAWGETEAKSIFSTLNYKHCISNAKQLLKYNTNSETGVVDSLSKLEVADDAAAVNWGNGWRIPSVEEYAELYKNCTFEEVKNYKNSGLDGKLGTSVINGKTIFFPYTGNEVNGWLQSKKSCYYWTNSTDSTSYMAYYWRVSDMLSSWTRGCQHRNTGCCVRAVKNK